MLNDKDWQKMVDVALDKMRKRMNELENRLEKVDGKKSLRPVIKLEDRK